VLAFATLLDAEALTTVGLAAAARVAGGSKAVRIDFSRDEDLEVTMAHCTFTTGCGVHEQHVLDVVLGLAMTCGAEEVAAAVSGSPTG
jgi:hypothetical protein